MINELNANDKVGRVGIKFGNGYEWDDEILKKII